MPILNSTEETTVVRDFEASVLASDVDLDMFACDITKEPSQHFKLRIYKILEPSVDYHILLSNSLSTSSFATQVDTFITAAETFSDDNGGA